MEKIQSGKIYPRVAMRPSHAPRTPPKTYEDGGNRKRKREPSLTPGGWSQSEQTDSPLGGEGRSQRLRGRRRGKGRGAPAPQPCPPRGALGLDKQSWREKVQGVEEPIERWKDPEGHPLREQPLREPQRANGANVTNASLDLESGGRCSLATRW